MKITVKACPKHIKLKDIKGAVRAYGAQLMSQQLSKNVYVDVEFNPYLMSAEGGEGFVLAESDDYREFTITIDSTIKKRMILLVLAHEMIHVAQYARGDMKWGKYSNTRRWRGKTYNTKKFKDYEGVNKHNSPWEKEAYGNESAIYSFYKG